MPDETTLTKEVTANGVTEANLFDVMSEVENRTVEIAQMYALKESGALDDFYKLWSSSRHRISIKKEIQNLDLENDEIERTFKGRQGLNDLAKKSEELSYRNVGLPTFTDELQSDKPLSIEDLKKTSKENVKKLLIDLNQLVSLLLFVERR